MNRRDESIIRAILRSLENMDGLTHETVLHAEVDLRIKPNALLMEFDRGLKYCEEHRWIHGVRPAIGATKWSLSDAGRVALADM